MANIKILVGFHKPFFTYQHPFLIPIHQGANKSNITLDMQRDDVGENISDKNANFCELTAMYWLYKNVDAEYYGLFHYRRYMTDTVVTSSSFDKISQQFKTLHRLIRAFISRKPLAGYGSRYIAYNEEIFKKQMEAFEENLPVILSNHDIIMPRKIYTQKTIYDAYASKHDIAHLDKLMDIIQVKYPSIYPYVKQSMHEKEIYFANMFIMKKEYFTQYSEFLFTVLFDLEQNIEIPLDPYQARVFGFLSERLMKPFVDYVQAEKHAKIAEVETIFLDFE